MKRPIKTSKKDFQNKRKAYPSTKDALKEIVTNSFFAPNVKNISLNFIKNINNDKYSCWFFNDGKPMTEKEIINAISEYGCESAKTAGNENGMGLKSGASYFTQFSDNSMLGLVSKDNGVLSGLGWIDPYGQYCEYEDFSIEQKKFVDDILSKFTNGTITFIYDTEIEKEEIDDFLDELRYMFTTGLKSVNFIANIDGKSFGIYPFDRHYQNLEYVRNKISDVIFKFKNKLYKCTLKSTDTRTVKPEDYDFIDETNQSVISDFGIHMGYDNGYMPIHLPQVEIIGLDSKPQYNYIRGSLIAHPIEDNKDYAGIEEWKEFFSIIGKMSQQKVPNLSKKMNYKYNGELKERWKSFYESVVNEFTRNINEWLPINIKNTESKYGEEKLNIINTSLEKTDFEYCDSTWKFRFGYNVDDIVKYDAMEKTIIFKFDETLLLKKLVRGGRNGRNGDNDIDVIIIPIIDIFKMDIEDENTTDKVIAVIKKRVRKINNYYSK